MFEREKQELAAAGSVTLNVRVRPGAKKTMAKSVMADGSIKIDLAAPAEDGKANAALIVFLADEFGVSRAQVEIVSGQTSRQKIVEIVTIKKRNRG